MGAHARQLSRLRLKSLSILKAENQWRSWAIWQYGIVPQANFQPLVWVTYARYDPAVKDKQSLHVDSPVNDSLKLTKVHATAAISLPVTMYDVVVL